tara:strand:+ start:6370 stop:7011 length:642 start_codon:yes stop_codon:yes gene_type:complete
MRDSDFECILWDFGGVFTGSPFYSIDIYSAHLGVKSQELIELVLGYGLDDGDHHWHRLERGEITMAEALEEIEVLTSARGIEGFEIRDFFKSMGGRNDTTEEMFDAVRRYKDLGISQFILSNNILEFSSSWKAMLPENIFDGIIDSSEVGIRKPDPKIFTLALQIADNSADKTIFLDDYVEHINVAEELGIKGIHVGPNPLDAVKQLDKLLAC